MNVFSRHNRRWRWVVGLVLALSLPGSPAAAENVGLVTNVDGKVGLSAYAWADGVQDADWSLSWVPSAGAEPVLITSGTTAVGGPGATAAVTGNLFEFWGMDPSFERSGANPGASPWTVVKTGDGGSAFVTDYESGASRGGEYFANPAQNHGSNRDSYHPAGLIRSQVFTLTGDAITYLIAGGCGGNVIPTHEDDIVDPTTMNAGLMMGVALRDAKTGDYLCVARREGAESNWVTCGFTGDTLAEFVGRDVTLDIFDCYYGGWAWMVVDDFQMVGDLPWAGSGIYVLTVNGQEFAFPAAVPEPATMTLLAMGLAAMMGKRRNGR